MNGLSFLPQGRTTCFGRSTSSLAVAGRSQSRHERRLVLLSFPGSPKVCLNRVVSPPICASCCCLSLLPVDRQFPETTNGDLCCFEVNPNLGLENENPPLICARNDRSKVSGEGFDEETRLLVVLLKFEGFEHQGTKSSPRRRAGGKTDQESLEEAAGT